ncbi:hypothetical protein [Actinokineospora inagensis]|uniref:hypothetical protein n=1 Tax=Actinokineospora inagensis TaxID=103730 RepID=UPI0004037102|nr:hypothetical protein [Actinokineospora inagensis]
MDNPQVADGVPVRSPQGETAMLRAITGVITLTHNVRTGRVVLDPRAGAHLLSTLREQRDEAADWLTRAKALTSDSPLGVNDLGMTTAHRFRGHPESDDTSFMTVLRGYVDTLSDAVDAVSTAMAAHQEHRRTVDI